MTMQQEYCCDSKKKPRIYDLYLFVWRYDEFDNKRKMFENQKFESISWDMLKTRLSTAFTIIETENSELINKLYMNYAIREK